MKDNPAISYAVNGDVEGFFDMELGVRKDTSFPPFSRMVNIVVRSTNAAAARKAADDLASLLRGGLKDTYVYGAAECPIEKIRASYRFQILLRSQKPASMLSGLNRVIGEVKLPYNVSMDIDVDPVDLL